MQKKYINLSGLRYTILILIIATIALDCVILIANCSDHLFFKSFSLSTDSVNGGFYHSLLDFIVLIGIILFVIAFLIKYIIVIVTSALFSFNCKYLNNNLIDNSVGWTIGYFFIPFISYFKPYQSIKEFYKISQNYESNSSPFNRYILIWWLLYIINTVSLNFISNFEKLSSLVIDIFICFNLLEMYFFYITFNTIFLGINNRLSQLEKLESEVNSIN